MPDAGEVIATLSEPVPVMSATNPGEAAAPGICVSKRKAGVSSPSKKIESTPHMTEPVGMLNAARVESGRIVCGVAAAGGGVDVETPEPVSPAPAQLIAGNPRASRSR